MTRPKFILAVALLATACSDAPTAPEYSSITVITTTLGGDLDQDGYSVTVGSERSATIVAQGTFVLNGITTGEHQVKFGGIADNCTPEGATSRTVTVVTGRTAVIEFVVRCAATGIEITTRTSGLDLPIGGYTLNSGERSVFVAPNGTVLMSRLKPGTHTVSIGVSENCSVIGGSIVTVSVADRAVVPLKFEIACVRIEKRIAFVRDTTFGLRSILVATPNGSSLLRLAEGHGPAWSPDGTKVIYSTTQCDFYYYNECSGGLFVIDPETRIVSVPPDTNLGVDPSWSPDGRMIAFSRVSGTFRQIALLHVLALDGSSAVQLDTQGMDAWHASWSPDGSRIAFTCSTPISNSVTQFDICIINRDGTGLTRLTNDGANDQNPAWSPDGSTMAFQTSRFSPGVDNVALMTPEGANIRQLTNGWTPAWSPDGSRLVFARLGGLFIIGSDGSNPTRLTTGHHYDPAWRP